MTENPENSLPQEAYRYKISRKIKAFESHGNVSELRIAVSVPVRFLLYLKLVSYIIEISKYGKEEAAI